MGDNSTIRDRFMGKKILTIDDSKTVRTIISKHLSQFSVGMLEAENGEQGVACAREGAPDLILLDYNMPVMDGYHTLVELKTDPQLKSIPVVMVTTETSKETVIKLLRLGLTDYIAKPFTRELLLEKINAIVGLYNGDQPPPEENKKPVVEAKSPVTDQKNAAPEEKNSKPTLLAVDDKSSVLKLLAEYIGDQFEIVTADSGRAAMDTLDQKHFEYMFLDLSMPDMSGFDILEAFLQSAKKGAKEKRVIAMTMRSAQDDISRATDAGIPVLFKPFTRADVKSALDQAAKDGKKMRFLTANGKIRILDCPADKSSRFRIYAASLSSEVLQEINQMVQEGLHMLVIKIGEGFLLHKLVRMDFAKLLNHISQKQLTVRLVADSVATRDSLKQFPETANIPIDVTLECALSSIS
jgi:two-component system, cell cycle response regulator